MKFTRTQNKRYSHKDEFMKIRMEGTDNMNRVRLKSKRHDS